MVISRRFKFGFLVCSVALLGACEVQDTVSSNRQAPLRIGTAKGQPIPSSTSNAPSAPQVSAANDPLRQHLLARKDVDPAHVNKKNRYTETVAEMKKKKKGPFRELSLKPQLPDNEPLKTALENARAKSLGDQQVSSYQAARAVNSIAPASGGNGVRIKNVRSGAYPGKTRLVLDASSKTAFKTRFENGGQVLVVDLGAVNWDTQISQGFAKSPLLKSYQVRDGAGGKELAVFLRKPAKLVSKMALPPNDIYSSYRIVLDISAL